MSFHQQHSANADEVVATVLLRRGGLNRHDLPGGVAIFYLFDGNEDRRHTCQWRVVGPDGEAIRAAVEELTKALDRVGVRYDPPRIGSSVCYFQDRGPWRTEGG